jgi:hypothetical protein
MANEYNDQTTLQSYNDQMNGPFHYISVRKRRCKSMVKCPREKLREEMRHHGGEVFRGCKKFLKLGGPDYTPETDDISEVTQIFFNMPENWMDRLDAVFVGAKRLGDDKDNFRTRYEKICQKYYTYMVAAVMTSDADVDSRYLHCSRVVRDMASLFFDFFNELKNFIGHSACRDSRWQ